MCHKTVIVRESRNMTFTLYPNPNLQVTLMFKLTEGKCNCSQKVHVLIAVLKFSLYGPASIVAALLIHVQVSG